VRSGVCPGVGAGMGARRVSARGIVGGRGMILVGDLVDDFLDFLHVEDWELLDWGVCE